MDISLSNAIIAETAQARDLPAESGSAARVLQPILGGENVRVSSALTGDLQKLLAQVRSEQDEKKFQLAHLQLSAVLGHLCAMSDLSSAQQAQVAVMQAKIDALDAAIARETTTVADRKKALATKRRLESEAQEALKAAEKSGDEAAVAEAKHRLEGVQAEAAALDAEIAKLDASLDKLKEEVAGYGQEVSDLLAKFDYPALVLVLAAISLSANDAALPEAKQKDEEADVGKIPTSFDILRESLERAVKDIREEIVEKRIEAV